jgi:predicted dehydrogenase
MTHHDLKPSPIANRRQFIRTSFAVGATVICGPTIVSSRALARSRTPNETIQIGVIGLGSRGFNLIDDLLKHADARIVALCDVDHLHYRDRPWGTGPQFGRQPAKEKVERHYAKQSQGGEVKVFSDFRELIALSELDAIVIATPDHWHALCTWESLKAGKDVYCEKPLTHLFAEGQKIYREVARRAAIFQTGSQQRSDPIFRRAVLLARNGQLGNIQSCEIGLPPGYDKPEGETELIDPPKTLDYDLWCGPAPKLPYMPARHHRWWRGHTAFGGGVLMDWIGHHNDIAHWAMDMDQRGPTHVEAVDWTFPETDFYNTPAQYTIQCEYPSGIQTSISSQHRQGLKIRGDAGWLFVTRGKIEASDSRWLKKDFAAGKIEVYQSDDHMRNFLDSMRTRKPCIAPAETAHRSITPGHLAYVSQKLGRSLKWDSTAEQVENDVEANNLLAKIDYREPWQLG